MDFRTKVSLDWQGERLNHSHSLIFFGSCFADEIGAMFKASKFNTLVNPFGVLYNPLSIAEAINRVIVNTPFQEGELFKSGNLYHSFSHHSAFSHTNKEYMLQSINSSLAESSQHLKSANYLFITFGTAWVYEAAESGKVVANCHKLPAKNFLRRRVSVKEIVECISATLENLFIINPNIKAVVTVSPIRHLKDGIHENSLSKSTLLLACEELQKIFKERVSYLPTYEVLLDELRDYRFYADDMAHPSKKAVEYIWEKIEDEVITPNSVNIIKEWSKIRQGISHRLMSADTEGYKTFLNTLLRNATSFALKYKHINIEQEIEDIKNKINNV
ncbi:MAG: GSCFA domain-containing protein [Bacteroidales bacterium]|nr:GSCFA domain-containing protein [Bacteroidales bacterium]